MKQSVTIDCSEIHDWSSFHDVFAAAFGFPDFYGRNCDAWIDCMTRLDEEFSKIEVPEGEIVVLQLENAQKLKKAAPDILGGLLEISAFVNWRRIEVKQQPILLVSGYA